MEKQKKFHFLLMVPFFFLLANSVLVDAYAIKETEIGNHVHLSRKNPNNEVRIRRLGKQLVRKLEAEMAKSSTPDDGGGGTLSMTVSLTNGPVAAAYPIPDEKIDPPALPNQSKSWHMPLWGWILIGFAIFAFFLVVTWVVWYYCSHRAASQTAGNQNGSTELDDIESLSSSTIDNIYSNIFRVPNPDASATPPRDPAILPNRARPWQAIFSVILLIAGAIWYYYSHCGDTEPDKPSQST